MTVASRRVGKLLTCTAALVPAVGAIVADWNETHVFNPKWPPHAKFHNAQTISLAWVAAGLTAWESFRPGVDDADRARRAGVYACLFWLTQLPAPFFPGTAFADPDSPARPTARVNQITVMGAVIVPLVAAGQVLLRRRR